jgi:hypothetical protein
MFTLVRVPNEKVASDIVTQLGGYFGGDIGYRHEEQFGDYVVYADGLVNHKRDQAHWFAIGYVMAVKNGFVANEEEGDCFASSRFQDHDDR